MSSSSASSVYSLNSPLLEPPPSQIQRKRRLLSKSSLALFTVFVTAAVLIALFFTGKLLPSSSSTSAVSSAPPLPFDSNLLSFFTSRVFPGPNFITSDRFFDLLSSGSLPPSPPSHLQSPSGWGDPAFQAHLMRDIIRLADSLLQFNASRPPGTPATNEFESGILQRVAHISTRYQRMLANYTGNPELYRDFTPVPKYWHGLTSEALFNASFLSGSILPDIGFTQVWTSSITLSMYGPFFIGMPGGLELCRPQQSTVLNGKEFFYDGIVGYWLIINQSIPFYCNQSFVFNRLSYSSINSSILPPIGAPPPIYPDPHYLHAVAQQMLESPNVPLTPFQRSFLLENLVDYGESLLESYFVSLARFYSTDRTNCLSELTCQILESPFERALHIHFRSQQYQFPYLDWSHPVLCINNTINMEQFRSSIQSLPDGILISLPNFHYLPLPLGGAIRGLLRIAGPNEIYLHQLVTAYVPGVTSEMNQKLPLVRRVNVDDPYDTVFNSTHVSLYHLMGKLNSTSPLRSMVTGIADPSVLPASSTEFIDPYWILANGHFTSIYSMSEQMTSIRDRLLANQVVKMTNECRPNHGN